MTHETFGTTSEADSLYTALFEALPGSCILLLNNPPQYTVVAATPAYLTQTGYNKEAIIGKGVFEMSPANPDDETDTGVNDLRASLEMVRLHKKPHQLPVQRYDIVGENDLFSERYWSAINKPVISSAGEVVYITHEAEDITNQVKADEKDVAHQELQSVTDTMPQLVWATEANGYSYFFNKGWLEYTGLTLEEVKGEGWMQSLHPEDLERTGDAWTKAYKEGAVYEIEFRLRHRNGNYRWFLTRGTPMKDQQGNILKWYGTTTDIHEQKTAQEALLQISERFDLVSKATQDAIWDWNLLNNEVIWNEGVQQLFGYTMKQVITRAEWWYDKVHPDDRDQAVATLHKVFDTGGSSCTREYRFRCADGSYKTVFDRGFIQKNDDDKPVRMIGSMQDITERKRMEEALRESEERFRFMVNAVPQSIWITDAEGRVEFLNQHWCNYCGEFNFPDTSEDISIKYLHPEDGPKVMQAFSQAMQTGEPWEVEQRNLSKEGEYRWFLNRAIPYKDPISGKIIKWFGVGVDIHERKLEQQALQRSEEELEKKVQERTLELQKANQELQRSNINLEEFAHAASHDMKEPIRKVLTFSDRLKRSLEDRMTDTERNLFSRVENATQRMGLLVDDLLEFSHVSERPLEKEEVDINVNVKKVLTDLELLVEEKKAQVNIGPLPVVSGYNRQLQQLLQNLIGNALKYSKPDQAPIITITSRKVFGYEVGEKVLPEQTGERFHLIEVSDNGIGFEPEYAGRIFGMFQRLHGKAEYPGTGVGLSIARKVVDNHNGYIWAESKRGEGATFKVLLPAE